MNTSHDLNQVYIPTDSFPEAPIDNSYVEGNTRIYFRNLLEKLTGHIMDADAIFGCVAWLTHEAVLSALKDKQVSIIVQKEDFLRPDIEAPLNWQNKLRTQYSSLKCNIPRYMMPEPVNLLSVSCDPEISAIRCVGNYNKSKSSAFPRMHNKFIVFGRSEKIIDENNITIEKFKPYGVWTGSFNFSKNAQKSLENAIFINSDGISDAYYKEYAQILSLSEDLDWTSEWVQPEWRVGS